MRSDLSTFVRLVLVVLAAPFAAYAGGPLFLDPATLTPIRYAPGPVPVYTDLGNLGPLSNEAADARVAFAWRQWTDVPTSSFEASMAGDFSKLGLPDVTAANAADVIGTFNGGGVHVVYDADGTLMSDFFGLPPSVLGIATPEFGVDGTNLITESWVVLNGAAIDPADADGAAFAGVMTHEFGHSINLGHSQTNGAAVFFGDAPIALGCTSGLPNAGPRRNHVETMYPFIDVTATGTGVAVSTVDVRDDVVSISNVYPAPGWPAISGTVAGKIMLPDGETQISGVNVVARNVADPWRDAVSAMSGDLTRGQEGVEGVYTLNGLTPGARYVVYVDQIVAGGFSSPIALLFPGPEEFYSGARESGDARADTPCDVETITASANHTASASIIFNADPYAPKLNVIGRDAAPFDITADGKTIVGYFSSYIAAPTFRWTAEKGLQSLGGAGSTATIAPDGSAIASNSFQDDGFQVASLWLRDTSWRQLPGLPGSCEFAEPFTKSVAFGVSNGGASVVGLGFLGDGCAQARPFRWDAATNTTVALPVTEETLQARANGISGDGSVVWGWTEGPTGFREGAIWYDGKLFDLSTDEAPVGEAFNGSPDGRWVVGGYAGFENLAWRWSPSGGTEIVGGLPGFFFSSAFAVSGDGNVIAGQSSAFFDVAGFIWTPRLGAMRLDEFLASQGTYVDPTAFLYAPNSMSADGRRLAGAGSSAAGSFGWYLDIDTVKVCHTLQSAPLRRRTIRVPFPGGLDAHLAHGDTLGSCSNGQ